MPTITVHEIGQDARKAVILLKMFRIGRDPTCELVLDSPTVSRQHAVVHMDAPTGNWFITCASHTNPVVVNRKLIDDMVFLPEGAEILIGSDHLLIFGESASRSAVQEVGQARFVKMRCPSCQWTGMVNFARRDAPCPRCGGQGLHAADAYVPPVFDNARWRQPTVGMELEEVRDSFHRLKAAKRSYVVRVDDWVNGGTRHDLVEGETLTIARDGPLKLRGLVHGQVTIAWNGASWELRSDLSFGTVRVNGDVVTSFELWAGDVIEVGSCRFRVDTE